jgi:tripartite-type tricarboxylate transporter receptor subunit TctC
MYRLMWVAVLGFMGAAWGQGAWAQARPLQMIVNFPAGSGTDINARALSESLRLVIGRAIVIVNRSGASGTIGVTALASAAPDGNTVGFVTVTPIALQPHLMKDLTYTLGDFSPICRITNNPTTLVVSPQSGFERISQVIEQARREPGKLSIGVPGLNSGPHTAVIEFLEMAKIDIVAVPYTADSAVIQPLKSGDLALAVVQPQTARTTGFRVLAVSSRERIAQLPDAPTFIELGYPVVQTNSGGIIGPKGLAQDFVRAMESACRTAHDSQAFQDLTRKLGTPTSFAGANDFTAQITSEYQSLKTLAQRLGLK